MPSLRFAPYRQIASEIAARLAATRAGADPLAPWSEEVIVPSRGVAEAITYELLQLLPNGVAGLRLHSLEELARRVLTLHGETPRTASERERRLAMRIAARAIDDPMMSSRGVAAMLERSYRDVRDSGFTVAEFSRRAEARRHLRNRRRTELVVRAWSEYERLIERMNAIDPAELLGQAAHLVDDTLKPQLLAGFYDMTGVQWQLTQALLHAERIAAIWIPTQAAFARPFIEAVGVVPGAVEASPASGNASTAPGMTLTTFDTRLEEWRHVCARVAALLAEGTPAREIGIVARSLEPYDARLLNRFAAEHGFGTTLSEETPLAAHRLGRGALTLLRLQERGFPRTEVLGLLRDGLRTQTRIDVEKADAATRRARIAGGTSEELRRMRVRTPAVEEYIALVAELESLVKNLELPRLSSLFRIDTDTDLAAAETLDDLAALFKRTTGWSAADVIDAIEHETLTRQTPAAHQPVIWAGELLRFRGRSFAHLFAVRMQDDVFPQRRTEDPLLPDSDRRTLGLREIGDGREEEQLLFELLAQSTTREVAYSFASGDGFGKVLRGSRYVRGVAGSGLRVALAETHSQPATRNAQRQLQLLVKAGTKSPFDGYIHPLDPTILRALSPTQLEDFGECPQKFLLKHILHVEDIDHPERELQIHHRDKGILDHRVLEKFYRFVGDDELRLPLSPELADRLDDFIDDQFDEHESVAPPFNRTVRDIERRATKRILREFVTADIADLNAHGLVPRHFEYRFGTKHREQADHPEPFVIEAGGVPVRVEGTIDRIDVSPAETGATYRIVDYKSGQALRHKDLDKKIDRGVRLQLALYAMAVAEFFGVDAAHVSGTIKPLVIGETKPEKFAFVLDDKRATLLETLEIFIRAILGGTFPAFPNEGDDFNSCKYCPVNHSCRTRHDLDERYAIQQARDPRTLLLGGRR